MRRLSVVVLSLLMILSFTACGQTQVKSEVKEAKIKVFFHCPNGKALIEKELVKSEGVKEVVADVETKVVSIKYDAAITDQDKLVAAIEQIGYKTELTPEGKEIKKACSHGDDGGQHDH